jgi:hypothetical protein
MSLRAFIMGARENRSAPMPATAAQLVLRDEQTGFTYTFPRPVRNAHDRLPDDLQAVSRKLLVLLVRKRLRERGES